MSQTAPMRPDAHARLAEAWKRFDAHMKRLSERIAAKQDTHSYAARKPRP